MNSELLEKLLRRNTVFVFLYSECGLPELMGVQDIFGLANLPEETTTRRGPSKTGPA